MINLLTYYHSMQCMIEGFEISTENNDTLDDMVEEGS